MALPEDKQYIIEEVKTIAANLRKQYGLTYFESLQIATQIQLNIQQNDIWLAVDSINHHLTD